MMKTTQTHEGVLVAFDKDNGFTYIIMQYVIPAIVLLGIVGCIVVGVALLNEPGDNSLSTFVFACLAIGGIVGLRSYFSKEISIPMVMVSTHTFTIIRKTLFKKIKAEYNIANMEGIWFESKNNSGKEPVTDDDYEAFNIQQQDTIAECQKKGGNLIFDYFGETIHFGGLVPTWYAEEFDKILQDQTNGTLRIKNLPHTIDEDTIFIDTPDTTDSDISHP